MEITRNWKDIARHTYEVGDFKLLDLGELGVIRMQVVAKDATELADGSGRASYDFLAMDALAEKRRMNPGDYSDGGWEECELRRWLNSDFLAMLPSGLRESIAKVRKYSLHKEWKCDDPEDWGWRQEEKATVDRVWIPSMREIVPTYGEQNQTPIAELNAVCGRPSPVFEYETQGPTYELSIVASPRPHDFWLRSVHPTDECLFKFAGSISNYGWRAHMSTGSTGAMSERNVVIGFSLT